MIATATSYLTQSHQRARGHSEQLRRREPAQATPAMLGSYRNVSPFSSPNLTLANEQLRNFHGWVHVCVHAIGVRAAKQTLRVARVAPSVLQRTKAKHLRIATVAGLSPRWLPIAEENNLFDSKAYDWLKQAVRRRQVSPMDGAAGQNLMVLERHPLTDVIRNHVMTRWTVIYALVANMELTGRGYLWIDQFTNPYTGEVEWQSWPIPTHWVTPLDDARYLRYAYLIRPEGSWSDPIMVDGRSIAEFSFPDPRSPIAGCTSPLSAQAKAVHTDNSIQTAQTAAMDNGIFPKHMIVVGKLPDMPGVPGQRPVLTVEQREALVSCVLGAYGGPMNAHEPIILDGLIEKIEQISIAPAEMDFMESSKLTKARIFQAYNVNPISVGEVEGANRAQAFVAERSTVDGAVNPVLSLISEGLTVWVQLAAREHPEFAELLMWIDPVTVNDPEMELRRWELGLEHDIVSGDEFRASQLNLPPSGEAVTRKPGGQRKPARERARRPRRNQIADDPSGRTPDAPA